MPDWLGLAREQFPDLGEAISGFADRHRDRVLRRHERNANINGLSNFMDVLVATSKLLFVYLRRGVLPHPQVIARMRDYLNIFTGKFPAVPEEETTGYMAWIYSNLFIGVRFLPLRRLTAATQPSDGARSWKKGEFTQSFPVRQMFITLGV